MDVQQWIATHLPMAVVASVVIALFELYSGAPAPVVFLTEFVLHVVAIFAGFVVTDVAWNYAFGDEEG